LCAHDELTDKKAEHCSFSLQFLASDISKKVLKGDNLSHRLDLSLSIFDSIHIILSKNLADEISGYKIVYAEADKDKKDEPRKLDPRLTFH